MRRLSAWSRALAGLLVPVATAFALAAPAGSATIPIAKARALAAKRLFAYVWSLSYVTDYQLSACTRASGGVVCGYRIVFHGSTPCSGTIAVGYNGRSVTSRFTGSLCGGAGAPPAQPAPTVPTTTQPAPAGTTTATTATTATTTTATTTATTTTATTTASTPAYTGVGGIHTLDSVEGSIVKLDDGSRWQVSGGVSSWLFDDVIDVAYSNGVYTLTDNNSTGSPVTATYLG